MIGEVSKYIEIAFSTYARIGLLLVCSFSEVPSYAVVAPSDSDLDRDGLSDNFERTHFVRMQGWGLNVNKQSENALGLTHVADVSAGFRHNLILSPDGTVFAWGQRNDVPPDLGRVRAISSGHHFSAALKYDGTVVTWGLQKDTYNLEPPSELSYITAIAAGGGHMLALDGEGRVAAWGFNEYGQTDVPEDLTDVVAIAAGGGFSLALKSDGQVIAWGNNYLGALRVPENLRGVRDITAGRYFGVAHLEDGSIRIWGRNPGGMGEIQPPEDLSEVAQIAAGGYHCVALTPQGQVVTWGYEDDMGAIEVPRNLSNVVRVEAGGFHTLVITGLLKHDDPDSDGDGLYDGAELNLHNTSPWIADTDGDGLTDGYEVAQGYNPLERATESQRASISPDQRAIELFEQPSGASPSGSKGGLIDALHYRYKEGKLVMSVFGKVGFRYRLYGSSSVRDKMGSDRQIFADFHGENSEVDIEVTPWCDTCFFFYSAEKVE